MAKKRRMTITRTCAPWSDLDYDLLRLVMMQLGLADYYSFRKVCKSWRSLAYKNENTFMESRPPMSISIFQSRHAFKKSCCLKDHLGRKFKTILPWFSVVDDCIGLTCGYLIFFTKLTRDFWLVNPITKKQLHFPHFPFDYQPHTRGGRAILVFSPSLSKFVFVVLCKGLRGDGGPDKICYFVEGEGAWNRVSYHRRIIDLYAFKGKIYTLTSEIIYNLCELRLSQQPKLVLLETKKPDFFYPDEFVSSRENLYVMCRTPEDPNTFHELDFGKMKWVKPCENTIEEYAFFGGDLDRGVAVKRESWAEIRSNGRYVDTHNNGKIRFFNAKMWYFPHECMNVDHIDE